MLKRKNAIVTKHAKGLDFLMRKNKVTTVPGYGQLTGPAKDGVHTIDVCRRQRASKPATSRRRTSCSPPAPMRKMLPGLKPDDRILTNMEILTHRRDPQVAHRHRRGRSRRRVRLHLPQLRHRRFPSSSTCPASFRSKTRRSAKNWPASIRKRGIDINVGAKVEKVEKTKDGVKVTYTGSDGKTVVKEAEKVLVAVGRAPRTEGIGLEKTKIKPDRGFIPINEWMADRRARHLRHRRHRRRHAAARPRRRDGRHGRRRATRRQICPPSQPQPHSRLHLHRAADRQRRLHRGQAKEKGHNVKVGKFPFSANSKASIVDSHDGFLKIVTDAKYGEILGVHIIGPQATELIAEAVTAIELEATVEEMMFTIHAHPTLAEGLLDGFGSVEGMAINV